MIAACLLPLPTMRGQSLRIFAALALAVGGTQSLPASHPMSSFRFPSFRPRRTPYARAGRCASDETGVDAALRPSDRSDARTKEARGELHFIPPTQRFVGRAADTVATIIRCAECRHCWRMAECLLWIRQRCSSTTLSNRADRLHSTRNTTTRRSGITPASVRPLSPRVTLQASLEARRFRLQFLR